MYDALGIVPLGTASTHTRDPSSFKPDAGPYSGWPRAPPRYDSSKLSYVKKRDSVTQHAPQPRTMESKPVAW